MKTQSKDLNLTTRQVVNPHDPKLQTLFKNLQGNILKGHGREHSLHVFLKFHGSESNDLRTSLKGLSVGTSGIITSALKQATETAQFKSFGIPGGLFGGIYLSRNGYEKLGFEKTDIEKEFEDKPLNLGGDLNVVSNFLDGMKKNLTSLGDPPVESWETGYQGDIDAVVLIADDDESFLLRRARSLITEIELFAEVTTVERGSVLRNAEGEGIEHFGYIDGRSQPIFLLDDLESEEPDVTKRPIKPWDPVEPLEIVLVPDKFIGGAPDAFGVSLCFEN